MTTQDKLLATWAKQNAETIYKHLETVVNPAHSWREENIIDIVVGGGGWPSEWEPGEPYMEEVPHILNDSTKEYGIPLPKQLVAYRLSLWTGINVPTTHPLVQDCDRWRDVALDIEFDNADLEEATELIKLLHSVANEEIAQNLPSVQDITDHFTAPTISGRLYTIPTDDAIIYLVVNDDNLAAMNSEGEIVVLDFDGNRQYNGKDMSRIQNYIVQGQKFSRPITDRGELASLVGNNVADMLLGNDTISIFDLPQPYEDDEQYG